LFENNILLKSTGLDEGKFSRKTILSWLPKILIMFFFSFIDVACHVIKLLTTKSLKKNITKCFKKKLLLNAEVENSPLGATIILLSVEYLNKLIHFKNKIGKRVNFKSKKLLK
jgi:hypothetical protein